MNIFVKIRMKRLSERALIAEVDSEFDFRFQILTQILVKIRSRVRVGPDMSIAAPKCRVAWPSSKAHGTEAHFRNFATTSPRGASLSALIIRLLRSQIS